jgi:hypothetical protein
MGQKIGGDFGSTIFRPYGTIVNKKKALIISTPFSFLKAFLMLQRSQITFCI